MGYDLIHSSVRSDGQYCKNKSWQGDWPRREIERFSMTLFLGLILLENWLTVNYPTCYSYELNIWWKQYWFEFILLCKKMKITEFYHRDMNLAQLPEIQCQQQSITQFSVIITVDIQKLLLLCLTNQEAVLWSLLLTIITHIKICAVCRQWPLQTITRCSFFHKEIFPSGWIFKGIFRVIFNWRSVDFICVRLLITYNRHHFDSSHIL